MFKYGCEKLLHFLLQEILKIIIVSIQAFVRITKAGVDLRALQP